MQLTTLIFPIIQIFKHKKTVLATEQALIDFDRKKLASRSTSSGSLATRSTGSRGKMFTMESLDDCLACLQDHNGFQVYASCMELNGENVIFLTRVLHFRKQWHATLSRVNGFSHAVMIMFRAALSIYIQLVHADTASYPINIESHIYAKLESIFGSATAIMASRRRNSDVSTPISAVTPWDVETPKEAFEMDLEEFPMQAMPSRPPSCSNESSDRIITLADFDHPNDPLADFIVPDDFDEHVFDAAFQSIKYMVWTETWQRYMGWRRTSTPTP